MIRINLLPEEERGKRVGKGLPGLKMPSLKIPMVPQTIWIVSIIGVLLIIFLGIYVSRRIAIGRLDRDITRMETRLAKLKREAETSAAIAAMSDAKSFLTGKLSPAQADRIGAALAESMLDRSRRKAFDSCLRLLADGKSFDAAFSQAFRYPLTTYVENWLKWTRGG